MSKKLTSISLVLTFILLTSFVNAEIDSSLKEKCEEKCKEVVDMIKTRGLKLTFKELNKKKGPFVWEDSFVYTIDIKKGIILSHNNRRFIGKLMSGVTNINGRKIYREFMDKGEKEGSGWISYIWKKRLKYEIRYTYVIKIPDHDILVISSTYNKPDSTSKLKKK